MPITERVAFHGVAEGEGFIEKLNKNSCITKKISYLCEKELAYETTDQERRGDHESLLGQGTPVCEGAQGTVSGAPASLLYPVDHKSYGPTYQYFAKVTKEEYKQRSLIGLIDKYFDNSYLSAVSALVKEEKISVEELKELIELVEKEK